MPSVILIPKRWRAKGSAADTHAAADRVEAMLARMLRDQALRINYSEDTIHIANGVPVLEDKL